MPSTCNWLSRAEAVAEVVTIQVTAYHAATTYTFKLNGKTISTIAQGSVNATATALAAAWNASTDTELSAITASAATDTVTLTADTKGVPFVQGLSKSVSGGTGTMGSVTTATAATGPNHWDNIDNWDTGTVPVTGDTANVNLAVGSVLYGMDQSAVTLAALNITTSSDTQNSLGLPNISVGNYTEYLYQYLKIGATLCKIDASSPRIKLAYGSVANSTEVRRTGNSPDGSTPPVLLTGTSTSNVLDVVTGSVGAAYYDGEVFATATATIGPYGSLVAGSGFTNATSINNLGTITSFGTFTALYSGGGLATIEGTPAATTIDISGGQAICRWGGTTANVLIGPGQLDATNDMTARTFTNTTMRKDGQIVDPQQTIVYTNKIALGTDVNQLQAA